MEAWERCAILLEHAHEITRIDQSLHGSVEDHGQPVATGAQALDRPDSWHHQATPPGGEPGAADVELTSADLTQIDAALDAVAVHGPRCAEAAQRMVDR